MNAGELATGAIGHQMNQWTFQQNVVISEQTRTRLNQ